MEAKIYCASHRGISPDAKRSMELSGYPYQIIVGVSDTALARNITLTRALNSMDGEEVIVLMDDDMQIPPTEMKKLVELAKRFGEPVSAVYVTESKRVAACQVEAGASWEEARWVTGLGALAIPRERLRQLADESEFLETSDEKGESIWAFCWSGPGRIHPAAPLQWVSEDYSLTGRLGPCVLAPIGVGHCKQAAIWPDETTLQKVMDGGAAFGGAPEEAKLVDEAKGDFARAIAHTPTVGKVGTDAAAPSVAGRSFFCDGCDVRRFSPTGELPPGWAAPGGDASVEFCESCVSKLRENGDEGV